MHAHTPPSPDWPWFEFRSVSNYSGSFSNVLLLWFTLCAHCVTPTRRSCHHFMLITHAEYLPPDRWYLLTSCRLRCLWQHDTRSDQFNSFSSRSPGNSVPRFFLMVCSCFVLTTNNNNNNNALITARRSIILAVFTSICFGLLHCYTGLMFYPIRNGL